MQNFLQKIKEAAQKNQKRILFPEGEEEGILKAIEKILQEKIAKPVLLGDPKNIEQKIKNFGLNIDLSKISIIDPATKDYATHLYKLRKSKGITLEEAKELAQKPEYMGVLMLEQDEVDGIVGGITLPTSETLRPALQIIKTKKKFHKVSGVFFMALENPPTTDRLLLFADCVVNVEPNSHDLADIAIDTAETAQHFGLTPRVAFLSFSTLGSAKHPSIDKIKEAVSIARDRRPDIVFEGELQVDAALVPEVAAKKAPKSTIRGDANILIFPDLASGNIAYKLVERLAKAHAIGPFLQGLKKPINDLSRGCSVEDIVYTTAFTSGEAI